MAVEINANLITKILFKGPGGSRFTQSSPILREVWLRYAMAAGLIEIQPREAAADNWKAAQRPMPVDLLIIPHFDSQAVDVADMLDGRIQGLRQRFKLPGQQPCDVADLPGMVVARLAFAEMCASLLPQTEWWRSSGFARFICLSEASQEDLVRRWADDVLNLGDDRADSETSLVLRYDEDVLGRVQPPPEFDRTESIETDDQDGWLFPVAKEEDFEDIAGIIVLSGLLGTNDLLRDIAGIQATQIAANVWKLTKMMRATVLEMADPDAKVHTINVNRAAEPAITYSVPTTKADAAQRVFDLDCGSIGWAILDSGVDGTHRAFLDLKKGTPTSKKSRVVATYDMTFFRRILSRDVLRDPDRRRALAEDLAAREDEQRPNQSADETLSVLDQIWANVSARRPTDFAGIEQLLRRKEAPPPDDAHGTHVAGILGAGEFDYLDRTYRGMCPTIRIYDFRVLSKTLEETELAVIGALQLIAHINRASKFTRIHGANLSLSLPHDVMNYACGRTPVCMECENLVNTGVVVVAAAGNRGYNDFLVSDGGSVQLHTSTSITDPGNTEAVITVGSTHRIEPHNYGVSYFSSRGPTGDGRAKPDLVAPGEKIRAPFPMASGKEHDVLGGTSMAAPHVSGAAAMLMARYPELIGQPARIKKILCSTATDLGRERDYQGHGLVDVLRALQSV